MDLFFPYDRCPICEEYTDGLCIPCRDNLSYLNEEKYMNQQKGQSIFEYNEAGKALLMAFKKRGSFYAGNDMVKLLVSDQRNFIGSFDLLTFAPSSKKSIKDLGFDHGRYLADQVSKETGILIKSLFLPSPVEQKKLDIESRKKNANNIQLNEKGLIGMEEKKVLILDDVYTTGSTVRRCMELLELKGIHAAYLTFFKLS